MLYSLEVDYFGCKLEKDVTCSFLGNEDKDYDISSSSVMIVLLMSTD